MPVRRALARPAVLGWALLGLALGGASAARASSEPTTAAPMDRGLAGQLSGYLHEGRFREALALLETRPDLLARPDGMRLKAELLFLTSQPQAAMALLRLRLDEAPADATARFQIAEIQFAQGRYDQAERAYRLALAGDLDEPRRRLAQARLRQISVRPGWRFSGGLAVAPDSNINGGSSEGTVQLFGLPFELSDEARRQGGVSVSGDFAAERLWSLSPAASFAGGVNIFASRTPGGRYDYAQIGSSAALKLQVTPQTTTSAAVTLRERWFAQDRLDTRVGARGEVSRFSYPGIDWSGAADIEHIASHRSAAYDGWGYRAQATRTRYLGPSSLWRLSASLGRLDLQSETESYAEAQVAAGRLFRLPLSISAYGQASTLVRRFEGASPFFAERRRDRELSATLKLARPRWTIHGATPFVQLDLTRSESNLPFGEYGRERIEFGISRDF